MTRFKKLTLLSALYLAQGLPYGFFTQALPVLLRSTNLSLPQIGLANLLTLPWALKFIWAPSVDRLHFPNVGLRKSWLVPLQLLSIALYFALGFVTLGEGELAWVLAAFLFTNLLAASQDVATDGLAVDVLLPEERGWANGIQVAGYRIGMIVGGGALLAIFPTVGWSGVMFSMAGIAAVCTLPVFAYKEPLFTDTPRTAKKPTAAFKEMVHFFFAPGAALWILVLLLYKFGHASATGMLRPWLVDQGYSISDIAWILGTGGFVAGFVGAMAGGWLAAKFDRSRLLVALGALQVLAIASYLWPVLTEHSHLKVLIAASLDHFTSGLATTTLFTLMMDACTKERAASDYTAQACVIVISQNLATTGAGFSAEFFGYSTHFALSTVVAVLAVALTAVIVSRPQVRELLRPQLGRALRSFLIPFVLASTLLGTASVSHAQESSTNSGPYEFGVGYGALLAGRKVRGIRELMEGALVRAAKPIGSGAIEGAFYSANGYGDKYKTFIIDYRALVWDDGFPTHVTAGLHIDSIAPARLNSRMTLGWQFGGGMQQPLGASGLALREDFSYRLGGGASLLVMVGLSYELR